MIEFHKETRSQSMFIIITHRLANSSISCVRLADSKTVCISES